MKSPDKNRFARSDRGTSAAESSGVLALDVEGHVVRESGIPKSVFVFGRSFSFEADGMTVQIEGRRYRLESLRGRACLIP